MGLLIAPHQTLGFLQSTGEYGDIFPRVSGMLMSGLGLSIFGMIRARSSELYPATLFMRTYFLVCIAVFYWMTTDPLFLVLIVIVGIGFVMTLSAYLFDRNSSLCDCDLGQDGLPVVYTKCNGHNHEKLR